MSRASKRPGYGQQRGSTNPKVTVSIKAPSRPKVYDIWIDISGTTTLKYWDGAAWQT